MHRAQTLALLLAAGLLCSGCSSGTISSNYRPVEDLTLVQTIGVDRAPEGVCLSASTGRVGENEPPQRMTQTGGNNFQFGGEEVLFLDAVVLGEVLEHGSFDRLLLSDLLPCGRIVVELVLLEQERPAAHDHVEVLGVDDLLGVLLHLLLTQGGKQVRDAEHGVGRILAHADLDGLACLEGDDAVDGERERDPLVLLDAAVIMRVE